jgi:hypothetical protein
MLLLLTAGPSSFAAPPSNGGGLFTDSPKQGDLNTSNELGVVRSRFVNINLDLLPGNGGPAWSRSSKGKTLPLNLFNDVFFTVVLDRIDARSNGLIWIGHIDGVAYSQVTLVTGDGLMAGHIAMPGAIYRVRYAGNGVHAVQEINQAALPPEKEPLTAGTSTISTPRNGVFNLYLPLVLKSAGGGATITIMVVYTPAARVAAGGTTAMNNEIALAVSTTNTTYSNSGITQRLQLVHTAQVSYTESSDMGTDLNRVTNPSDGYMDNVHALRNTYAADLVNLLVEYPSSYQWCGVAWLMTNVSHAFESWAFSVVWRGSCAVSNLSFAHELGHNMGALHDWYMDAGTAPYTYAHGYVNATARWRTIMAYNNRCTAAGFSCTRLQYWSNPDITYGGAPLGVAEGTSTACTVSNLSNPPCDADNRKTLNNTASTIAGFR